MGAGHAHLEVVKQLGPRYQVSLISASQKATYSGMMPGVIAGHYERQEAEIDLPSFCARYHTQFIEGKIKQRHELPPHDLLSFNLGSVPFCPSSGHDWPAKPFSSLLRHLETPSSQAYRVVGTGAAGVEISLALRHRFAQQGLFPNVELIGKDTQILANFPLKAQALAMRALARAKIDVRLGTQLKDVSQVPTIWATGAYADPAWASLDLPLAPDGFIPIEPTLQVQQHQTIFAVGDCAHLTGVPKLGVVPVRQAPILIHNLIATLEGRALVTFNYSPNPLALISLGRKSVIACKGEQVMQADWLWWFKNRIDKRFIARYQN